MQTAPRCGCECLSGSWTVRNIPNLGYMMVLGSEQGHQPVSLLDASLRLWPVLNTAGRDVAIEGVCSKGQVFRISLSHHRVNVCSYPNVPIMICMI